MKKSRLIMLPAIALLLSGCQVSTDAMKTFNLSVHLNGGEYATSFINEKNIKDNTYTAYINLGYYEGALRILPQAENLIAPQGKAFAGWYFDEECTPQQIVSEFAMDKLVNIYDTFKPEERTMDVYAKWIDEGTVDLCIQLNNTKKESSSVHQLSTRIDMGASFTESFKQAHPNMCGDDVYIINYDKESLVTDGVGFNDNLPKNGDAIVTNELYDFDGCAFFAPNNYTYYSGDESWRDLPVYNYETPPTIVGNSIQEEIINKLDTINGGQQTVYLNPVYYLKPVAQLHFKTSWKENIYDEVNKWKTKTITHLGIPGEFLDSAKTRYDETIKASPTVSSNLDVYYEISLKDLLDNQFNLASICPTKADFKPYDFYGDWNSFTIPGWKIIVSYKNSNKQDVYEEKPFTKEYIESCFGKFGLVTFNIVASTDCVL